MISMKPTIVVALVSVVLISCCPHPEVKDPLLAASVPDAGHRFTYSLSRDPADSVVIAEAIEQAKCLILSGSMDDCREDPRHPSRCNDRDAEEIDKTLKLAFAELMKVKLASPSTINRQILEQVPGAVSTTEVYDARRAVDCRNWKGEDGACVAVKIDHIWVLLHASATTDGEIHSFEVFLAEFPCGDMAPGSLSGGPF